MKLTKKIEQEVLKVYNTGWDSYMKGDLTTHSTCLSSKFKIIGTTEGENFNNKQAWLAFCKKTVHQVVGVAQMRNRKIKLDAVGDGVMVVENSNIYVLIEGKWKFYSKIRITALLQKEKTGWKYVHQHGSLPDTRASEDETLATKQVKKENLQLREAVKRRTIELEEKNRELEIEAALERIRARALAMHSSAELTDVAKVLREQMGSLGQPELETSAVHLYNEEAENIYSWRAFRLSSDSKSKITYGFFKIPKNSCAIAREFLQKFKSRASDYTIEVSGTKQSEWYKILFKLAPEVGHAMEKSGTTKEKRYYHLSKFTGGALLMVSSKEPSTDAIELQKRSAQVFDLAYRRFKDLQKVEVQAKEAQIEAALERVRSRSMAMHKSEELHDVAHLLYEQFKSLGETTIQFTIGIANEAEKLFDTSVTEWSGSGKAVFMKYKMPFSEPSLVNELFRAWQKNKPSVVIELKGVRLNKWVAYRNKLSGIKVKADKPRIITAAFFSKGFIAFSKHEQSNAATVQLLERFTGVFNQTYTRFLDLQKAEVQAKEAQIEAALERVRSQTMAMHNSEDMGKCILKMFNELTGLGIHEGTRFGIGILNHENENNQLWTARKQGDEINMHIGSLDMNLHPLLKSARKAWKEQLPLHTYILKGEDLLSYYRMLNDAPDYKILVPIEKLPEKEFHYGFVFEHGFFYAFTPREFQPDLIHIAQRFAKVFEQTYRRYLDLVKAETQAREAQIEAALERVRSRSLAMYKSDELREVLQLIFEQLWQLNFNIDSAQFGLNYKESDDLNVWTAVPGQPYPTLQHIPYFSNPVMDSAKQAKEMGLTFFSHIATREEKNKFFNHFFSHIKTVPQDRQKYILDRPGFARSVVFLDTVFLGIQNYSGTPYTDTENAVLRRFGKVFEQSYTRFLDLQKAEVQAREAQIEAALERVRSASLAMHHSEDLEKVVSVLSQRLVDLGFAFDGTLIFIFDKSKSNITLWIATVQLPAPLKVNLPYEADMMENPVLVDLWNAIVRKENNINRTYTGKVKDDYFRYVARYNRETISEELQQLHLKLSAWSMSYVAKENAVLAIDSWSGHVVGENEFLILNRFAVVFEQAYTRFLDLQKAEVQAREAQIEAALERVRSRSMAMHNSADLSTVVFDMFTELVNLDAQLDRCLILIVNPHTLGITWYLTGKEGLLSDNGFLVQDNDHPSHKAYLEGWRTRRKKWKYLLAGEEKKNWDTFGFSQTGLAQLPEFIKADMANVEAIHLTISSDSFGCLIASSLSPLADEHAAIVERFTLVFNQTYTRFLDLQKAEAQAREAQIEAALERVRAKAMALKKSGELKELIVIILKEFKKLGFGLYECNLLLFDTKPRDLIHWGSGINDSEPNCVKVPYFDHPFLTDLFADLNKGVKFRAGKLSGKALKSFLRHLLTQTQFKDASQEYKDGMMSIDSLFFTHSVITHGFLEIVGSEALSEEKINVLKRFTRVVDMAYTRFDDVVKAEAQAREAQIEAALERVRAQTMAMHNSEDVGKCVVKMFSELTALGVDEGTRFGIGILNHDNENNQLWTVRKDGEEVSMHIGNLDMTLHPLLKSARKAWKEQAPLHQYVLEGEDLINYYQMINTAPDYRLHIAIETLPDREYHYGFIFNHGFFYAFSHVNFNPN
ncbi:MAG: nuclear transport factor 2 family protein [Cyclobacteriaceae bacterium]|nr:nuclear transport factor 2 family protein [Cyclobacteriaceae bacterium]